MTAPPVAARRGPPQNPRLEQHPIDDIGEFWMVASRALQRERPSGYRCQIGALVVPPTAVPPPPAVPRPLLLCECLR